MMPLKIQIVFKLNPMFYIVQGYRESFIYFSPFWKHPYQTLYFWVVAIAIFIIGAGFQVVSGTRSLITAQGLRLNCIA